MKKYLLFVATVFLGHGAYAADTALWGPGYLNQVANAWASIITQTGPSAVYAARIQDARNTNLAQFYELISIIGNNDTAITLFETNRHIDTAMTPVATPMRPRFETQRFLVDAAVFGATNDYDSNENANFKTNTTGVAVSAQIYLADSTQIGVEYTRSMTDTKDDKVYTDAVTNSLTLFAQYHARPGWFLNGAANIGKTRWANDKTIAGVKDSGDYDTEFLAGQISGGIQLSRGPIVITPQIGARYTYVRSDRHIDGAAQSFEKWFFNTLAARAGVEFAYDFVGPDFRLRPMVRIGGGYDALRHGSDFVRVHVLSGQYYDTPIDAPSRFALDTGVGLRFYGPMFSAGLEYRLDLRQDYINHNGWLTLKIAF